jgi:hypothetical protein
MLDITAHVPHAKLHPLRVVPDAAALRIDLFLFVSSHLDTGSRGTKSILSKLTLVNRRKLLNIGESVYQLARFFDRALVR